MQQRDQLESRGQVSAGGEVGIASLAVCLSESFYNPSRLGESEFKSHLFNQYILIREKVGERERKIET